MKPNSRVGLRMNSMTSISIGLANAITVFPHHLSKFNHLAVALHSHLEAKVPFAAQSQSQLVPNSEGQFARSAAAWLQS